MFSSNLQEADTFKPMVVELELSYLDLNIQEVELKWLEIIKKNFKFKKVEISPDHVQLIECFPIMKCEFRSKSIDITIAIVKDWTKKFKEFIDVLVEEIDFDKLVIKKVVHIGGFMIKDNKKLLGLSLEEEDILSVDVQFTVKNANDTTTRIRIFDESNRDEQPNIVFSEIETDKKLINSQDLYSNLDSLCIQSLSEMNKYLSLQTKGNLSFLAHKAGDTYEE